MKKIITILFATLMLLLMVGCSAGKTFENCSTHFYIAGGETLGRESNVNAKLTVSSTKYKEGDSVTFTYFGKVYTGTIYDEFVIWDGADPTNGNLLEGSTVGHTIISGTKDSAKLQFNLLYPTSSGDVWLTLDMFFTK